MSGIAQWWDGIELWVAGLPFVPQVVLTLGVLVPLAAVVAAILDRLVGAGVSVAGRLTRSSSSSGATADRPSGTAHR